MTDEETMALCAIRYCMGRRSYVVSDGVRWARQWGAKSPHVRSVVIRDIEERLRYPGGLGDERIDAPEWLAVLNELRRIPAQKEEGRG